jgi:hypothetical protein
LLQASALDELDKDDDDRNHEQDMNEPAHGVRADEPK